MKTIKFIIIIGAILLVACENPCPDEEVYIQLHNNLLDTINVTMIYLDRSDLNDTNRIDSILPSSTERIAYLSFIDKRHKDNRIRNDVFTTVITDRMDNKQMIVTTLTGDTIANWSDNSVVFNDRQYWTITENIGVMEEYYCTLNLTDEVLKLK